MTDQKSTQDEGHSPKPKKKVHGCFWALGILIALIILGGIFGGNDEQSTQDSNIQENDTPSSSSSDTSGDTETSETSSSSDTSGNTETSETSLNEDLTRISAIDLWNAYDDNEISADQQYEDQDLIVTGVINDLGKDIFDTAFVNLDTGNMFQYVKCMFDSSQEDALTTLSKGNSISIKGTCNGMMVTDVQMIYCEIVE